MFRDKFMFEELQSERRIMAASIRDFVPLRDGLHYIGIITSRLLETSGESFGSKDPAGILIGSSSPAVDTASRSLERLMKQVLWTSPKP